MNKSDYISEQLNFWQLLDSLKKVEIPILQRDYAQGRPSQLKIRTNFLSAIKSAITTSPIELDFIYGSIDDGVFKPLDGQQRLTTLFLLYWYFFKKEVFDSNVVKIQLKKFSYRTRFSSRDFCTNLVDSKIKMNNLLPADQDKNNSLSKTIKDSSWFFIAWKNDPTITSMLTMLDHIHNNFSELKDVWGKFTHPTSNPITFEFINLKNFGLSDDLYIKMNARGKLLTSFENFKATFVNKIDKNEWEPENLELINSFSYKADTDWTDLFWDAHNDLVFDRSFIRFIAYTLMSSIALSGIRKDIEEKVREIFNFPHDITAQDFEKNSFETLKNLLNKYAKLYNDKELPNLAFKFPLWNYLDNNENESFYTIIKNKNKLSYPQLALFYAQNIYILSNNIFNKFNFDNWMRIVRNIVHHSNIDSAESYIGAVKLIYEISKGSSDIYNYLSSNIIESKFASDQISEEIIKAKIITSDSSTKDAIHKLEDTFFCSGKIEFFLHCLDFKTGNQLDVNKLNKTTNILDKHFSDEDFSNRIRSALFTIGDNQYYNYWSSTLHAVGAPKVCLIEDTYELIHLAYNDWFRPYLKELFKQLMSKDIDIIINDFVPPNEMPSWKIKLIQQPKLLNFSQKHYIAIKADDTCCYLIPGCKVANSKEGKKRLEKII